MDKTQPPMQQSPMQQSPMHYYVCEDGSSNTPCPKHFPGAEPVPDNWMQEYTPEVAGIGESGPGLTDKVDIA